MNPRLANVLRFAGFLSVGILILGLVFRSQNAAFQAQCVIDGVPADECSLLGKLLGDLALVRWPWLFLTLCLFMMSNFFRAWRWQQLVEPLGRRVKFWNSYWAVMIGYLANLGLPRMGEVVRAGVLGRYEGVAVEKVMGTVVVDRILDVLCLLTVVGIAFVVQWDLLTSFIVDARSVGDATVGEDAATSWLGTYIFSGLFVAALGVGVVYYLFTHLSHTSFVQKVSKLAVGFGSGLKSLTRVRNKPLLVFHTFGIWTCYFAMAYVPFFAFPPTEHLGPDAALMVFVFSALGIIIPSPGGLGSYHLMVIQALAIYDVPGDDALSFANILFFAVNIGCNILFGILGLLVLPIINRGRRPAVATALGPEPVTPEPEPELVHQP